MREVDGSFGSRRRIAVGNDIAEPEQDARGERVACLGPPVSSFDVRVVSEAGEPLEPGSVGEIWLRGGTLARRYLDDGTRETLRLKMLTRKYEYQSDFARTYFGQGKDAGLAEGKALGRA